MAEPDSTAERPGIEAPSEAPGIEAPRVLLVMADADERRFTTGVLASGGVNVVQGARHYAQAITAIKQAGSAHWFDAVVSELDPKAILTPSAYIQALRRFAYLPVIFYAPDPPDEAMARSWGAHAALAKPDDVWSLPRAVKVALGRVQTYAKTPRPKP